MATHRAGELGLAAKLVGAAAREIGITTPSVTSSLPIAA